MEKNKRALLLVVLLLMASGASAWDFICDNLCYNYHGGYTEVVVVGCFKTGEVVVPSTATDPSNGRESNVVGISNGAFQKKSITSIVISNGVKTIGESAFSYCTSLTSAFIANSVTSIGEQAFYYCSSLQTVTMGDKVTSIERSTFQGCENLKSIYLSSSITSIGTWAFAQCKSLESITLPASLTKLGENAVDDNGNHCYEYYEADEENDASYSYKWYNSPFSGCTSLKSFKIASSNTTFMTIDGVLYSKSGKLLYEFPKGKGPSYVMPDGVKYTNDYAFTNCINLTTLTLSDDLQLGYGVFGTNDYLETLNIGKTLTAYQNKNNVGVDNVPSVLSSLTSLSTITVNSQSTALEVYSGALYRIKDDGTKSLLCYPKKRTSATVEIANGCATIGAGAFMNHYYLQNVVLPEGVQVIEKYAFQYCSNLQTVSIPSTLKEFGYNAFEGCTSLNKVDIADVKAWCEVEYTFPDSDYDYDSSTGCRANPLYYAHRLCLNGMEVENVTIPDGTKMSGYPFWGCNTLKSVVIGGNITYVGAYAFAQCPNLESVTIGKDVKYIYEGAFYDGDKLTTVTVKATTPPSLSAWSHPFPYRSQATLYVPAGCKATYEAASNWRGFKEIIEMPALSPAIEFADANVKAICVANWDTDGDGELSEAEAAAVSYLYSSFSYNTTITSFDELCFFTGLTDTGQSTFSGCTSLSSITLPKQLSTIGWRAFAGCKNLKSISLPDSINNIGVEAFSGCTSIENITIPGNKISFGGMAFENCISLKKVVTDNVEAWMKMSFSYNGNPLTFAHHLYTGDEEVTNLVVPSSIEKIGYGTFAGCTGLKYVTIPSSVKMIDYAAFSGCTRLEKVIIDDLNAWCSMSWGSGDDPSSPLYYAHHLYLGENELTELVIPDGITSLGTYAFSGASSIVSVDIPESVTWIGDEAFCGCNNLVSVTVRNGTPIVFSDDTYAFTNRTNATLYVPYGSKAAYEAADYWKDFKEIVEMQPELTEKEVLSVEALETKRGKTVEMAINLTNESEDLTAFQFDITLPAGITLAKAENGKYLVSKTERFADDDQQLNVSLVTGNTYRVVCFSMNKDVITCHAGALLNVVLQVSEDMEAGQYEGQIENIVFTKTDGTQEKLNDAVISIEVKAYAPGDANGDGEVNVTDIVEMVNAIMEQPSERFIAEAADVNGDGEVNVTDIVLVVSMIMNDNGARGDVVGNASERYKLPQRSEALPTMADVLTMVIDGMDNNSLVLRNAGGYVAAQFDVRLGEGQQIESVHLNGLRENGHTVTYEQTGRNTWRVMVYSLDNEAFLGNDGEWLNIRVNGNAEGMAIENILFVTDRFVEKHFAPMGVQPTGVSTTLYDKEEMTKENTVYDLQGRRVNVNVNVNVNRGLYIVNGKKMLSK